MADIQLLNAFKVFDNLPHQIAAAEWLDDHLTTEQRQGFQDLFRAAVPAKDPSPTPSANDRCVLTVPYEFQNDNKSGQGFRECYSSSCAMVARYYGKVSSDDQYNAIRSKFGDSTDTGAQLRALSSLGLQVQFKQNGSIDILERLIRAAQPVPVGWLHKGPVSAPAGGGHWSVVIGFTQDSLILNDPNGEADLVNGGYVSTSPTAGKGIVYSKKNWLRRWEADGKGSGWYLDVKA